MPRLRAFRAPYRFWRLFWARLSRASLDERIALAQDVIEHRHDGDGEAAFVLVDALVDPLRRAGRSEMIDRIIERIREISSGRLRGKSSLDGLLER